MPTNETKRLTEIAAKMTADEIRKEFKPRKHPFTNAQSVKRNSYNGDVFDHHAPEANFKAMLERAEAFADEQLNAIEDWEPEEIVEMMARFALSESTAKVSDEAMVEEPISEIVETPNGLKEGLQDDLFCLRCGYNIRITVFEPDKNQRASCDRCESETAPTASDEAMVCGKCREKSQAI